MGNILSDLMSLFGKKEAKLLLLGLDAAGKTAVLYRLKLADLVTTIPTIGFNVETVEYKNLKFTMWDIGGQDKLRPLWRHYYEHANGIVFVVDSADKARFKIARDELHKMLEDPLLHDAKVCVFANKQDLPGAHSPSEVAEALQLNGLKQGWFVQGTSATQGRGLFEGLEWLSRNIKTGK